jgi:hypothetical protein
VTIFLQAIENTAKKWRITNTLVIPKLASVAMKKILIPYAKSEGGF